MCGVLVSKTQSKKGTHTFQLEVKTHERVEDREIIEVPKKKKNIAIQPKLPTIHSERSQIT